jgi:uncharacterized protein (DUF1778 family)
MGNKDDRLELRLGSGEKALLARAATQQGTTPSELLRQAGVAAAEAVLTATGAAAEQPRGDV